ncbi:hemin ABC transporter substrate-binding protein [Ideonella sp. A 288]|uniref:heme/hemin ABC transporter substrate-binding protein n=1 Tax=Ideonella sp. A 288 TaxID=1962181 RepID=UPI001F275A50|nr:ABC transporter substrate-binding protein [Ideonella sp. A 288]
MTHTPRTKADWAPGGGDAASPVAAGRAPATGRTTRTAAHGGLGRAGAASGGLARRQALCALAVGLVPATARPATGRLVVTDGGLAEIVVALGGAHLLVAVGHDADHLAELSPVPRLPEMPEPSADPLLAADPTRVVIGAEWATPRTLDELHQAGVRVHVVDSEPTAAGVARRIRIVAAMLQKSAEGEALVARFQRDMQGVARLIARVPRRPRALFVRAVEREPLRVAGHRNAMSALLGLLGTDNVAGAFDGFEPMGRQAMIAAAPEFILTNPAGTAAQDGLPLALHAPGALETPAGRGQRLIVVHGPDLHGIGLHTPRGIRRLGRQLHPTIFA